MKQRFRAVVCSLLLLAGALPARNSNGTGCGTHIETAKEEAFLGEQALQSRIGRASTARTPAARSAYAALVAAHRRALIDSARASNKDFGNIAAIDDSDGAVYRRHPFPSAYGRITIRFSPSAPAAARYRVQTLAYSFDPSLSGSGHPVSGLGDDDARSVPLPFAFPFYGSSYRSVFINSDGNLTFNSGDAASTDRSLGRMTAGPPRISPLFADFDPSAAGSVRVYSDASRFVITWDGVPLFGQTGKQTFQLRMYPDGSIEFAYNGTGSITDAVIGIAPGRLQAPTTLVSFVDNPAGDFSGAVAERFAGAEAVDVATVAQKFYATHDDAYDYLVIYNAESVAAASGAVAYETTVRNDRSGYGDEAINTGAQFGSNARLQAVMNMGPLDNYMSGDGPLGPDDWVPMRGSTHDTPVTVLGHEAGHLFLAFASIRDPLDPKARPMLNPRNLAHWAFTFNSDASLLEGNRIEDQGETVDPRFRTSGTVEAYSALDQYLMGFRPPADVDPTFLVTDTTTSPSALPRSGILFEGKRRNIMVDDMIAVEGRRTPDSTVAQRHFRFAFILVVPAGQDPTAAQLAQVESYRAAFEKFYAQATGFRATADASLKRAVQFSASPAIGVLEGRTGLASITVAQAPASPAVFGLITHTGAASVSSVATIPTGSTTTVFTITGVRAGVEELTILPADSAYETVYAKVQVLKEPSPLYPKVVSGDRQTIGTGALRDAIEIKVTDVNRVSYSGVRVSGRVSPGGSLEPASASTDEHGIARFRWTPAPAGPNELTATVENSRASATAVAFRQPTIGANGPVNAASYQPGLCPGGIASLFGTSLAAGATESAQTGVLPESLAGVQVLINGTPVPLYYVSDSQINFVVPPEFRSGEGYSLSVSNPVGVSPEWKTYLVAAAPGIFFDAGSGAGAVLIGNTDQTTLQRPAAPGELVSIYCTGLGATRTGESGLKETLWTPEVRIGGVAARVLYSGEAPGYRGLYQINAEVPPGAGTGAQVLAVAVNGFVSNYAKIFLR